MTPEFNFITGEFVFSGTAIKTVSGQAELQQWIDKRIRQLNSPRKTMYYNTDYDGTISDLFGTVYTKKFREAELEREIKNALLKNTDIMSIDNFRTEIHGSAIHISFTVNSVYGKEAKTYDYS